MTKEILQVISLIISLGLSFVNDGNYQPERELALEEVNWEAYQYAMSEEEYLALQDYLPVLTNESSFKYTNEYLYNYDDSEDLLYYDAGHDPRNATTISEYRNNLYSEWGEEASSFPINVRGVALCDIDDDETYEMILYISFLGGHFVIFDQENGTVYGADKFYRTFEQLQTNGVYVGSGGVGNEYYYQYHFVDTHFTETYLGHTERDDEHQKLLYYIGEEQVGQETFESWEASVMVGDVDFYAPSM